MMGYAVISGDPPTITDIADQTTAFETATGPIAFTIGDTESTVDTLTVTASSDNQTLVPDANIDLAGADASRAITLTPATGEAGAATITVTVSDGLEEASDTFTLTVEGPDRDNWVKKASDEGWKEVVDRSPEHGAKLKALFTK